jgi:molybdate transport repressor ModE-like protein
MDAHWKIWLEHEGRPFFGDGRARLLEAIRDEGSLTAAAAHVGMSYRKAWERVNQMERIYGARLIDRQTGGRRGGGCSLTEEGVRLLDAYREFREAMERRFVEEFEEFQRRLDG